MKKENMISMRKKSKNELSLSMQSKSKNESLARTVVAAFLLELDPTLEELADIKTAVSEAVTNAVIHGYDGKSERETEQGQVENLVHMRMKIEEDVFYIEICDEGVGIVDVKKAMEPLYTTKPDLERSGMGFMFMESFMNTLEVFSKPGVGTTIRMSRRIGSEE